MLDSHTGRDAEQYGGSPRLGAALFVAALLAASFLFLLILNRPLIRLLGIVSDDAFYYLQIARHLAASGVSTFDGINPTNGYHPAWMIVTTLCATVFSDRETLLRGALLVGLLFHLVTGLLLARVLRDLVGAFWGWIGGAVWLMSPFPLLLNLQGVETPLYFLALVLVVAVYLRRIDPYLSKATIEAPTSTEIPAMNLALFGCALGLTFWSRTEGGVLALLTILFLLIILWRRGVRSWSTLARTALIVGGAFLLVAAPWIIYSMTTVGGFGQDSGAMKLLWAGEEYAALPPFKRANEVAEYLYQRWLGSPVGMLLNTPHEVRKIVPALLGGAIAWWIYRHRRTADRRLLRLTAWLVSASFLTGLIYGILFTDWQIWHFGQPGLVLYLIGFVWGITALEGSRLLRLLRGRTGAAIVIFCAALALLVHFGLRTPEPYPWQRDVYTSQSRFESQVPPGAPIGSFNAGIPAYFSDRTVVNLDGLVNHTAARYWSRHRFEEYLREAGIRYIADEEEAIRRAQSFSSAPIVLAPVDSVEITGWLSKYRKLWRVER